jgi:hypothetical protein
VKCPQCSGECERDEVDNGVGMEAVGPWGCPDCYWVAPDAARELGLSDDAVDPHADSTGKPATRDKSSGS